MSYDNLQCFCMQHMSAKNTTTCQADGKDDVLFFYLIIMNNAMHQKVHIVFPKLLLSWKLYEAGGRDDTRPWKAWKHWLCAWWNQETLIAPAGQGVLLALASDFQHWHEILDCLEVLTTRMTSDPALSDPAGQGSYSLLWVGWLQTISSSHSQLGSVERKQQKSVPRTKPLQWMAHDTGVCKEGSFMVRHAPHSQVQTWWFLTHTRSAVYQVQWGRI